MAAFLICRDVNAPHGLVRYRNDRVIIIPLCNKRDDVCQDNLDDIRQARGEKERLSPGTVRLIR